MRYLNFCCWLLSTPTYLLPLPAVQHHTSYATGVSGGSGHGGRLGASTYYFYRTYSHTYLRTIRCDGAKRSAVKWSEVKLVGFRLQGLVHTSSSDISGCRQSARYEPSCLFSSGCIDHAAFIWNYGVYLTLILPEAWSKKSWWFLIWVHSYCERQTVST